MNIIICGAGMGGFSISKQLQAQGHSVTVIDQSSEDIKKINDIAPEKANMCCWNDDIDCSKVSINWGLKYIL